MHQNSGSLDIGSSLIELDRLHPCITKESKHFLHKPVIPKSTVSSYTKSVNTLIYVFLFFSFQLSPKQLKQKQIQKIH